MINTSAILFVSVITVILLFVLPFLLLRKLAILNRNVAQAGSFLAQLTAGQFAGGAESTLTEKLYFDSTGKPDNYRFREVLLTSGTKWTCDACGDWHLSETNGSKSEAAVRELLDCFGFPRRFLVEGGVEEGVYVTRLATLLDLGLGLPIEYLHRSAQAERAKGNEKPGLFAKQNSTEAPGTD